MGRNGTHERIAGRPADIACPPHFAAAFARDTSGAIAALYAVAMFVLVAIAGVAWDWTRMTALDTELQNAADQAALAAATQLDGETGAIDRATAAASELVVNMSRMANDDIDSRDLTVEDIVFYQSYDQATDAFGSETADDAEATVVQVTIAPREAVYAITPIIGLFRSGEISAQAAAALGSAICNTPPVMICNPFEDSGDPDLVDFDPNDYIGVGLKLITDDAGAPGNFGFLRNGLGTGAQDLARAVGYDDQPGECVPGTGVTTEPGLKDVVFNAINTRFDISVSGANTCPNGGTCSAAANVRKDLVHRNQCGTTSNGWQQSTSPYRPTSNALLPVSSYNAGQIDVMGLPRDTCHAWSESGDCTGGDGYGIVGTGTWDRDAYFYVNYGWDHSTWMTNTGLGADATRYEVYMWEIDNPTTHSHSASSFHQHSAPYCRTPAGDASRRLITAAVIDCSAEGVAGHKENVAVRQWMELLLVEPSFTRRRTSSPSSEKMTDSNDVYVEIVRAIEIGDDGEDGEVIRRDVPYLIR